VVARASWTAMPFSSPWSQNRRGDLDFIGADGQVEDLEEAVGGWICGAAQVNLGIDNGDRGIGDRCSRGVQDRSVDGTEGLLLRRNASSKFSS
jgi:hypothetical protein